MRGAAMVRIPNQNIQSARPCRPASLLFSASDSASQSRPPIALAVSPAAVDVGCSQKISDARREPSRPVCRVRIAMLANADETAARRANGAVAGMANTPSLVLSAPDAAAGDAAAMAVRAAAAKGRCRRGGVREIDGEKSCEAEQGKKFFHKRILLEDARYCLFSARRRDLMLDNLNSRLTPFNRIESSCDVAARQRLGQTCGAICCLAPERRAEGDRRRSWARPNTCSRPTTGRPPNTSSRSRHHDCRTYI